MPVAGQVTPDHLAFGQNGDDDGDGDGCAEDGHQELPVVRGICARRLRQGGCKRGSKPHPTLIFCGREAAPWFDHSHHRGKHLNVSA